jgi:hypothetical protein
MRRIEVGPLVEGVDGPPRSPSGIDHSPRESP